MRAFVLAVFVMTAAMGASGAEEHPIDRKLGACIDENPSTAGMVECIGDAYAAWDGELNDAWKALMGRLSPPQQEALRKSQRQWLAWRDAEFATIDAIYGELEGTMFLPMRVDERMQIVRERARALRGYHDLLTMDE